MAARARTERAEHDAVVVNGDCSIESGQAAAETLLRRKTTVAQPKRRSGNGSVRLLIEILNGEQE